MVWSSTVSNTADKLQVNPKELSISWRIHGFVSIEAFSLIDAKKCIKNQRGISFEGYFQL